MWNPSQKIARLAFAIQSLFSVCRSLFVLHRPSFIKSGGASHLLFPLPSIVNKQSYGSRSSLLLVGNDDIVDDQSDDGDLFSSGSETGWLESLRARQIEISQKDKQRLEQWKTGECKSAIALALPDWIRRIDVSYPLVACGSASETIYVGHLEREEIIARSTSEPVEGEKERPTEDDNNSEGTEQRSSQRLDQVLRELYGQYDGGGTLAIAFDGNLICAAGRGGGVGLWRLDTAAQKLVSQRSMIALEDVYVTCLELDEQYLWVGSSDGRVLTFPLDSDLPLSLQTTPAMCWKVGGTSTTATVLSLAVSNELGCAVASTSVGSVDLLALDEDLDASDKETGMNRPMGSFYPPFDSNERRSSNTFPLSVELVSHVNPPNTFSVVCGGNDGSLYLQPLKMVPGSSVIEIDWEKPFSRPLRTLSPTHIGRLKCLASPCPGLLVSGGQDGTVRLWDADERKLLYQFLGYKVWLGSLCVDSRRLISDGADNTVIMHDFGAVDDAF